MVSSSGKKYENLGDYAVKLNDAIRNVRKFIPTNSSLKKWNTFFATLEGLSNIMKDMLEISKKIDAIDSRPIFDREAIKGNKSAEKAEKITIKIRKRLSDIYENLREEFLKKFDVALTQYNNASNELSTREDKERLSRYGQDFSRMATTAKRDPQIIPLKRTPDSEKRTQNISNNNAKNEAINEKYKGEDYDLVNKFQELRKILSETPQNKTTKAIIEEMKAIRKAKPAAMVQVAKDTLDRLRHSAQLIQDLEDLSRDMNKPLSVYSRDSQLQKVTEQIAKLIPLLEKAQREEEAKKEVLKDESKKADERVEFAQQAIASYSAALPSRAPLPEKYQNMKAKLKEMSRLFKKADKAASKGR